MKDIKYYIKVGEKIIDYKRWNDPCCNCHCGCVAESYIGLCRGCRIGYHMEDAEKDAGF